MDFFVVFVTFTSCFHSFTSAQVSNGTGVYTARLEAAKQTSGLLPLSEEFLEKLKAKFYKDPKNVLAQNACTLTSPFDVSTSRYQIEHTQPVFTHKIESEGRPVTDQKNSGRCWMFAGLNVIRIPFMQKYKLPGFEFSQSYLFFWDKVERSNYFLNMMVETAKRGEPIDGRLVSHLLEKGSMDGGQWDMFVNLINKHGLMPKSVFPESFSSESTTQLDDMLGSKLREFTLVLRRMVEEKASDEEIKTKINEQMEIIFRIVGICFGIPSTKFTWEYVDTAKQYHSIGPVTPLEFYQQYVKPVFNVDDKVCLVTDPRPTSKYNQAYTVDALGNVVGGRIVLYNNQPVELLAKLSVESIKNNHPVWFGSQTGKRFGKKFSSLDLDIYDYNLVFGVDFSLPMTKAERMQCRESAMSHAMVLTGVSLDDKGEPTKWRVENSWGEGPMPGKGYLFMTQEWFEEYVFEVVVDKSIVPKEILDVFDQVPVKLPAWDPMGAVANTRH